MSPSIEVALSPKRLRSFGTYGPKHVPLASESLTDDDENESDGVADRGCRALPVEFRESPILQWVWFNKYTVITGLVAMTVLFGTTFLLRNNGQAIPLRINDAADAIDTFSGIDNMEIYDAAGRHAENYFCQRRNDGFEGSTGIGYVDFLGQGAWLEFTVTVSEEAAPPSEFEVKYSSAFEDRPLDVLVDGVFVGQLWGHSTLDWNTWSTEQMNISPPLTAGKHKIRLFARRSTGPNVDWLALFSVADEVSPFPSAVFAPTALPSSGAVAPPANESNLQPSSQPLADELSKWPTVAPTTTKPPSTQNTGSPTSSTTRPPSLATPSPSPPPSQTNSPSPTPLPTNLVTPPPTDPPTPSPTDSPTPSPTDPTTPSPTDPPTLSPTDPPIATPSTSPIPLPTDPPVPPDDPLEPEPLPSTNSPTVSPTKQTQLLQPSVIAASPELHRLSVFPVPQMQPTHDDRSQSPVPSFPTPFELPTISPHLTSRPSTSPTPIPSTSPTPSQKPTPKPILPPKTQPTPPPTHFPTPSPTTSPTPPPPLSPTALPTPSPTPQLQPTPPPTHFPTPSPTPSPIPPPTLAPTPLPTPSPTPFPSSTPTLVPNNPPTPAPTRQQPQVTPSPNPPPPPPSAPSSNYAYNIVMGSGAKLERGMFVLSPNGRYKFGLNSEGELRLLDEQESQTVWKSGGPNADAAYMQTDGNFLARQSNGQMIWQAHTSRNQGAILVIDDGGQAYVRHRDIPIWLVGKPRGQYNGVPDGSLAYPLRGAFYYAWYPETWAVNGKEVFYRPTRGKYATGDPDILTDHVRALEYANVDVSIVSWWGPDKTLDRPRIFNLLDRSSALNSPVKWSVYHEEERVRYMSVDDLKADLSYLKKWFAWHKNWAHIDGKPVIFVYNKSGCEVSDRWKQAAGNEWYVVLKLFPDYLNCPSQPDHWHQYGPAAAILEYPGASFTISPGFWRSDLAEAELGRVGKERWTEAVLRMVNSGMDWQLVTTFNEWGEGTAVESAQEWASDSGYGYYMDALHDIKTLYR